MQKIKLVIDKLMSILNPHQVEYSDEMRIAYSFDATNQHFKPDIVVFPESEEDVSNILKIASEFNFPVTPRGAGVGFSGGSLPVYGGIVLVMTRMNRILEIDEENLIAIVEPGVITHDLQESVKSVGLFYPPDPASVRSSTIGGNVAECAGGLSAVKYGVTKHYVLGIRFVLPNGAVCEIGGKAIKNVAGYDLIGLLVGSEGTLAVITELTLKLLPLPKNRETCLVSFNSLDQAALAVSEIIRNHIVPSAIELMDKSSMDVVSKFTGFAFPNNSEAVLIIETDGMLSEIKEISKDLNAVLHSSGGVVIKKASDEKERETIWDVRRAISPAISTMSNTKINEDVSVPRSKIPHLIRAVDDISMKYNINIVTFGHAGDGNIHVNLMVNKFDEDEMKRAAHAAKSVMQKAVQLGGSISGEHGIGISKKKYLPLYLSEELINVSKNIKKAFDPNNILNPGKIFPD